MVESQFDRDLRRAVQSQSDAEPPATLVEWLEGLPAAASMRSTSRTRLLKPMAAAALVIVAVAFGLTVYAGSLPKALPSGEPLTIVTEPNPPTSGFCFTARISGVVMKRNGSEVVFETGYLPITWPYGTKALLVDGQAQLFAPDGTLIATEGQTLPDLGGGALPDGRFHVCSFTDERH
jgi:hypothetical protein